MQVELKNLMIRNLILKLWEGGQTIIIHGKIIKEDFLIVRYEDLVKKKNNKLFENS